MKKRKVVGVSKPSKIFLKKALLVVASGLVAIGLITCSPSNSSEYRGENTSIVSPVAVENNGINEEIQKSTVEYEFITNKPEEVVVYGENNIKRPILIDGIECTALFNSYKSESTEHELISVSYNDENNICYKSNFVIILQHTIKH